MKYYIRIDENNLVIDAINYTILNNELNFDGNGKILDNFFEIENFPKDILNNWYYEDSRLIQKEKI